MKTNRLTKMAGVGTISTGIALAGCSSTGGDDSEDWHAPTQPQEQGDSGGDSASAQSSDSADYSDSADGSNSSVSENADLSTMMPSTSAEDAVKTAQDKIRSEDGTLHAVELDYDSDDGKWEYDVKIMDD